MRRLKMTEIEKFIEDFIEVILGMIVGIVIIGGAIVLFICALLALAYLVLSLF